MEKNKFEKRKDPRTYENAKEVYGLSHKQWKFCMVYCHEAEFIAYRAAAWTYGNCDGLLSEGGSMADDMAKGIAYQNMHKPHIAACIQDIIGVGSMTPGEVMNRLTKMASANFTDILDIDPVTNKTTVNLNKAIKRGATYIIKKLNFDSFGNLKSVELHDAFAALAKIGQHHKLFDRQRETPLEPRELARELLDDLRAKHEDIPDHMLVSKVLERFSGSGVTESDLVEIQNAPDISN
jgi:hypothetical protein